MTTGSGQEQPITRDVLLDARLATGPADQVDGLLADAFQRHALCAGEPGQWRDAVMRISLNPDISLESGTQGRLHGL
jgi:hypothetical protein